MILIGWLIFLVIVGIVLLVAELLLPTHGIIGVMGAGLLAAAAVLCFIIHPALGLGAIVGGGVALPVVWALFIKYWPRSPVGRRIILNPTKIERQPLTVQIGQSGQSVSCLRPVGTCEFAGQRLEALSEYGIIEPGRPVRVVALNNRRPVVREVPSNV